MDKFKIGDIVVKIRHIQYTAKDQFDIGEEVKIIKKYGQSSFDAKSTIRQLDQIISQENYELSKIAKTKLWNVLK